MNASRFRKRPVVIDAIQYTAENCAACHAFIGEPHNCDDDPSLLCTDETGFYLDTLEGHMCADFGDWIIRGIKGEFYPCKPDIFDATYEPAGDVQEAGQ